MGVKERREREKELRRNAIIDAAEKVFFSSGIDRATMDQVAEEAELSKGTLYLYFKSKEDLYLAIINRGGAILKLLFQNAVAAAPDGLQKVQAIGQAYCEFCASYPHYFNAMLYFESYPIDLEVDENSFASACWQQNDEIFQILIEALRQGLRDGSIRSDIDPEKMAFVLWGQTTGILQIASIRGDHLQNYRNIDPQELIDASFELLYHALAA